MMTSVLTFFSREVEAKNCFDLVIISASVIFMVISITNIYTASGIFSTIFSKYIGTYEQEYSSDQAKSGLVSTKTKMSSRKRSSMWKYFNEVSPVKIKCSYSSHCSNKTNDQLVNLTALTTLYSCIEYKLQLHGKELGVLLIIIIVNAT